MGRTTATFRTRVAATCKAAGNALHAEGPFPFPTFDPQHPTVADLPTIARYEAKTVAALRAWQTASHTLGQPITGSLAWTSYSVGSQPKCDEHDRTTARCPKRDTAAFTQTYRDLSSRGPAGAQAASAIGLPTCDPSNPA